MGFFSGRRVLVTGGSGLIGSSLIRSLEDLGAEVIALQHAHEVEIRNGAVICGDIRDRFTVDDLVSTRPEFVFHLAAQAIVTTGEDNPAETIETNVNGTANLLLQLRSLNNLHGVICAATDKVYGRHERLPYRETDALLGVKQVYEASKVCADVLAQVAAYSWKLPIGITRFGNVYGPGDRNLTRIIPGTIFSYLTGRSPIIRSNGQAYRDYIYIDDVVDGYLRMAYHMASNPSDEPHIFNFGTSKAHRVLDIVAAVREHFPNGPDPKVMYGAKDEIEKQYVSGDKAKAVLGWQPKVNLREGISCTVDWWKELYDKSN